MRRRKRGIALAGGGPLGAIWEIGALVALDEALAGLDFTGCDVFVGVSSGAFIAAGLANGIGPRTMHRMFIESAAADEALDPDLLLRPALGEYARCVASLPELLTKAAGRTVGGPLSGGGFDSLQELARALPRSVFDNAGVGDYLADLFSAPGRTNDFRRLAGILFLVATDLDTAEAVEFGSPG
ncbi:MAG: Patatin, partial [Rhizobiaceae bacterium]|nr:Patatin [Rhizobiaceae bacterium]